MNDDTQGKITERIMSAPVDSRTDLSNLGIRLEYVKFDRDEDGYSWIAREVNSPHYLMPMKSTWMVKSFKTLKGAKRNFLRRVLR